MKNLLLISIEDLNDWVEPLGGHPHAVTPNISRLAAMGVTFENAYAAAPVCSPSRTATLFSKFPWETGIYANDDRWSHHFDYGKRQSIIGHLRSAGMETLGCGKVFFATQKGGARLGELDRDEWDEFHFVARGKYPAIAESIKSGDLKRTADFGIDPTDEPSYDDINTDWMVDKIQPGAAGKVWALGIYRPHLPFIAPKKFFDMIPDEVALPPGLGMNSFDPDNGSVQKQLSRPARRIANANSKTGQVLVRHGEYNQFLRSYLASIAYADSKLGLVLDRLEECGLIDDTLIVLWSDHGWQLGEKLAFRKFTLWERALRVPVMFAGGGLPVRRVDKPISLVDLAPTIAKMMGAPEQPNFSGQDLTPAIYGTGELARPYAPSAWVMGKLEPKLAFTVRTEDYRYIRYWNGSEELYDHTNDPFEHRNLAHDELRNDRANEIMANGLAPVVDDIQHNAATPRVGMNELDEDDEE